MVCKVRSNCGSRLLVFCVSLMAILGLSVRTSAETWYFTGAAERGNFSKSENWTASDGVTHPAYPPTSANCDPNDEYVVKDGRQTRSDAAGTSSMQIYGHVTYGEIDGTTGKHMEYGQYPASGGAQLNFRHSRGVVFAHGTYTSENIGGSRYGNRVMGLITVTAPSAAPFEFATDNNDAYIAFENAFSSGGTDDVGMTFKGNKATCTMLFKGSLTDYLGSMAFTSSGMTIGFGANTGTLNLNTLSLAAGTVVTVDNSKLSASALVAGDGVIFDLAVASSSGAITASQVACETLSMGGSITLRIPTFADPAAKTTETSHDLELLAVTNGQIDESKVNVDLSAIADKSCGKEVKLSADGKKLILTLTFAADTKYYLTANSNQNNNFGLNTNWTNLDGESPEYAPGNPSFDSSMEVAVKDGMIARDGSGGTTAITCYAKRITYGVVGGTKGNLWLNYQNGATAGHTYRNDGAYFANGRLTFYGIWNKKGGIQGKVTVTAPSNTPFEVAARYQDYQGYFNCEMISEAGCGLKFVNCDLAGYAFFVGALTNYHGSIAVNSNWTIDFGANIGWTDFSALSFASVTTTIVNNVTHPLKANSMTFGDGAVVKLAMKMTNGKYAGGACLQAGNVALDGRVTLMAELPKMPANVTEVPLLISTAGSLDATRFDGVFSGAGAKDYAGLKVVDKDGASVLVAQITHPGIVLIVR